MSNVTLVVLAIFVSALGGGIAVAAYGLAKQVEYLKEELAIAKENWARNGQIAREYQVLCGNLEEAAALNREAFKEVCRDRDEAWEEVERLRGLK